jgi:tetratricopeptide (TPR) repeat protein
MKRMGRHQVSRAALARFAAGEARPRERQQIVLHLLGGCEPCRGWVRENAWGLTGEAHQPPPGAYDRAFAVAERAAMEEAARRTQQVHELLEELDRLPPEEREPRVRNDRRFASTALAATLVERSHQARWRDPAMMCADAQLAVAAAEGAVALGPSEEAGELNDSLARAWGQLATAHRLRGDLLEAEDAFAVAFHHLDEGTGDPPLRAQLYRQLASLRRTRRQFNEATELLQRAISTFRRVGDKAGEAATLINLGISYIYAGDTQAAIPPLRRCLEELHPRHHADLIRTATHNLVRCYLDLGESARAHALWLETEQLYQGCDDELVLLRHEWHRALIDCELGFLQPAETRLARVREGFLKHGMRMESAVASLDLAAVYLRQRRVPDVVRTVGEAIPIFQSLGWEQEILVSLTQLAGAAHDLGAALELLHQILRTVDRGAESLPRVTLPQG